MKVRVRGLVFDVSVAGPVGGAPVLLLHGFPQHHGEWDRVEALLHAAGRMTIAPDQRGYSPGARPSDVEAYAVGECVADAVAILGALDIERADVVGHDWGSIVGWHVAGEYPDRVRTYTGVSVPHPVAFAQAVATDPDQQRRSSYFGLFREGGHAEDVLLADGGARLRAMFAGCPAEVVDAYVEPMLDRARLTGALNWYRAMGTGPQCPLVTVPTTFVWGDRDVAVGAAAARACADHVEGDYQFVSLPGVSHWVPDEAPEALTDAVLARLEADLETT